MISLRHWRLFLTLLIVLALLALTMAGGASGGHSTAFGMPVVLLLTLVLVLTVWIEQARERGPTLPGQFFPAAPRAPPT